VFATVSYFHHSLILAGKAGAYPSGLKGLIAEPGNPYRRGRLDTVDLLIKIACLVKKTKIFSDIKGADLY
jgi:hypothetical protein